MASRPIIKIFKLEKVWANKHRQGYKSLLQRDRTFVSFLKFFFLRSFIDFSNVNTMNPRLARNKLGNNTAELD